MLSRMLIKLQLWQISAHTVICYPAAQPENTSACSITFAEHTCMIFQSFVADFSHDPSGIWLQRARTHSIPVLMSHSYIIVIFYACAKQSGFSGSKCWLIKKTCYSPSLSSLYLNLCFSERAPFCIFHGRWSITVHFTLEWICHGFEKVTCIAEHFIRTARQK